MINIAVLGYGTVGSGVVEVINTNQEIINQKAGQEVHIKYVLDLRDFPGDPVEEILVHDYKKIVKDEEVDIIVEVMGGLKPAYSFVKQALAAGKSVVTSNKELVAKYGAELLAIAKQSNVNFLFEASVGGGIPVIRPLLTSITADDVTEITGILNGTTNYILTRMEDNGDDFARALKTAQDNGYAEREPEADVEGHDACRKIAILASLVYGKQVDFEDIYTEGITKISDRDIRYAKNMNAAIKLLATVQKVDGKLYAMVVPMMIKEKHPLFHVNDVFNAVMVHGNMVDDLMFYGRGAGKLPTASAVVSDVVDAVRHLHENMPVEWSGEKQEMGSFEEAKHKFFVRFRGDTLDDMEIINEYFGNVYYVKAEGVTNETAFITSPMTEAAFNKANAELGSIVSAIRVGF